MISKLFKKKSKQASISKAPLPVKYKEAVSLARYNNHPIYKLIASELVDHGHIRFWEYGVKALNMRAAIFDTGLNKFLPEFRNSSIIEGRSFIEGEEWHNDENGHGTFVASQIYAQHNLAEVVSGREIITSSCPQLSKLYIAKVLDKTGNGPWQALLDAFKWIDNMLPAQRPHIINCSLSGDAATKDSDVGKEIIRLITKLRKEGTVTFAAAGNYGLSTNPEVRFFANTEEPYAISATENFVTMAEFSSYGKEIDYAMDGSFRVGLSIKPNLKYAKLNGTSMASPDAVGFALLSLCYLSKANAEQATKLLKDVPNVLDLFWKSKSMIFDPGTSPQGKDDKFGYGILYFPENSAL